MYEQMSVCDRSYEPCLVECLLSVFTPDLSDRVFRCTM